MGDEGDRTITFDSRRLRHSFKHAAHFGINGNANSVTLLAFEAALATHVNAEATEMRSGTYRQTAVTHFIDQSTRLNVMRDRNGKFLSGWALSEMQLAYLLSTGKLGGGL